LVTKIGISGTGFIANGIIRLLLNHHRDLVPAIVLTRRPKINGKDFILADRLTNSLDDFVDGCDLVVECSGDPVHATDVVDMALKAGKSVVTMNAEFQVTTGSYFVDKGYITEAEGDQPGCLAALHQDVVQMGFKPLVYGNMKGYLNHHPVPDEMQYWADRQGFSRTQTTSFTDGTKLQVEQVLIGNAVGATIARQGLIGPQCDDLNVAANELSNAAMAVGNPIVDYVLSSKLPSGVFIVATHDECEHLALRNYRLGSGPYFVLLRPYHLCAIEAIKTMRQTLRGERPLLQNGSKPILGVAAIAKQELEKGSAIDYATGGFMIRGEAVKLAASPNHVPIGVLQGARLRQSIEPGQMLTWDDVELVESKAVRIAESLFRPQGASKVSKDSLVVVQ
jgi:predicted homoserine dehydrogenase-like protein